MRIIAGSAGGIRLQVPEKVARPTSDRVREALFSILGARVIDARVLDLFAGSGALGMEALSRGARSAQFVESDRRASKVIGANLEKVRLSELARVVAREVEAFLRGAPDDAADLVFADPPYLKREGDTDFVAALLADAHLLRVVSPDGMVVLETAKGHLKNLQMPGWELLDSRSYGDTEVSFLNPESTP